MFCDSSEVQYSMSGSSQVWRSGSQLYCINHKQYVMRTVYRVPWAQRATNEHRELMITVNCTVGRSAALQKHFHHKALMLTNRVTPQDITLPLALKTLWWGNQCVTVYAAGIDRWLDKCVTTGLVCLCVTAGLVCGCRTSV